MSSKHDEILIRLQETIGSWNEDVTGAQTDLARQISEAKEQLDTLVRIIAVRSPGGSVLKDALVEAASLREASAERKKALSKATQSNIELSSQIEPLKERVRELRRQSDDYARINAKLREEIASARDAGGGDSTRLRLAESRLEKVQTALAKRGTTLEGAIEDAELSQRELAELHEKNERLELSLREHRERASEATLAEAKVRARLLNLEPELRSLRQQITGEGSQNDSSESATMREELAAAQAELETVRAELASRRAAGQDRGETGHAAESSALREQNETLESEVLEYAGQLEESQEKIARLEAELDHSKGEFERLIDTRREAGESGEAEVASLRAQLSETNSALIHAKGDIETLGAQLEEQRESLRETQRMAEGAEALTEEQERERSTLDQELDRLRSDTRELADLLERAREERSSLRGDFDDAIRHRDALSARIEELEDEIMQTSEGHTHTRQTMTKELEDALAKSRALQTACSEKDGSIAQLETALGVHAREMDKMRDNVMSLTTLIEEKDETSRGLKDAHAREVDGLKDEARLQKEELEEATFSLNEMNEKVEALTSHETALQKRVTALKAESETGDQDLEQASHEVAALEGRLRNQLDSEKSLNRELDTVRSRLVEAEEAKRMADESAEMARERARESARSSERNEAHAQSLQSELDSGGDALEAANRKLAAQTVRSEQVSEEHTALKAQLAEQQAQAEGIARELRREIARLEETLHAQHEELQVKHDALPQWTERMEEPSMAARIMLARSADVLKELKAELLTYEAFLLEQDAAIERAASLCETIQDAAGEVGLTLRATLENISETGQVESFAKQVEENIINLCALIEEFAGVNDRLRGGFITFAQDERGRLTTEALDDPAQTRRLGSFLASKGILPEPVWAKTMAEISQGRNRPIGAILAEHGISGDEALRELVAAGAAPTAPANDESSKESNPQEQARNRALDKMAAQAGARIRQLETDLADANRLVEDFEEQVAEQETTLERFSHDLTTLLKQTNEEGEEHRVFLQQLNEEREHVRELKTLLAKREAQVAALEKDEARPQDKGENRMDLFGKIVYENDGRRRTLGEILLVANLIDAGELEVALEEQRESTEQRIGSILVDKGLVMEKTVSQVVASQLKLPFVELSEASVEVNAANLVTAQFALNHQCLPVRIESGELTLAMANPLDGGLIEELQYATDLHIQPVVATPADITSAIGQHYAPVGGGEEAA